MEPASFADLGEHERQHCVRFNPVDVRDIVTNGQNKVVFWNWTEEALSAFHPPRGIQKLKKGVGTLTQTVFIPYTTKAVTATSTGNVVLWDYPVSELVQSSGRDAIKILKLINKSGINLLDTVSDRYVVCGCADGGVRFFDFQFRVVAWFEDIQQGQITSVSFAETASPASAPSTTGNATMDEFTVPTFIVGTTKGKIIRLESKLVDDISEEHRRGTLLVQGFDGDVFALDAHPSLPVAAIGTTTGTLQLWDLDDRVISATRRINPEESGNKGKKEKKGEEMVDAAGGVITKLKFGPLGDLLAVGFADGNLKLISADQSTHAKQAPLSDVHSVKHSLEAITDICWSHDGQYFATADADRCVALYRWWHHNEELDKPMEWVFVGKFQAHYKPITGIYFAQGQVQDSLNEDDDEDEDEKKERAGTKKEIQLFSLGEDCVLHEYDLAKSSIRQGLKIRNSTKVDQVATPTACVCIPGHPLEAGEEDEDEQLLRQIEDVEGQRKPLYTPDLLITANDEYKLKVWDRSSGLPDVDYYANYSNSYEGGGTDEEHAHSLRARNLKVCRRTLLAPTYGGPINKLFVLPKRVGSEIAPSQYLVYSTHEKCVGLVRLPLDGNPNKAMALIAHPGQISGLVSTFDGKYLLTAGGADRSVNLWSVTTEALEASIALSGTGVEPYMGLLEGGKGGEFYQDLLDYFYYAQLCSQGIETTAVRDITGYIPVNQVVYLMRALGYYPTQQEVMDISNEIKFSHHKQISSFKDKVDLEEFIKLYVNYRPVFGLGNKQFRAAFQALKIDGYLGAGVDEGTVDEDGVEEMVLPEDELQLSSEDLMTKLTTRGEAMSLEEITETVKLLVGQDLPPGVDPRAWLKETLAAVYSPNQFAQDVLGFEDYQ
jgi:WD40 repeat protein